MNDLSQRERRYLESLEAMNPSSWLQERIDLERRDLGSSSRGIIRSGNPVIGFQPESGAKHPGESDPS